MTANINPKTGIAYGYISARALDHELVDTLLNNGNDLDAPIALSRWQTERARELFASGKCETADDAFEAAKALDKQAFWDSYEAYEPTVEGTHEGVTYCSSWLGGALNFFISESPFITDKARLASPCAPNAGILDTLDGSVTSYDVPASWRRIES